MMDHVSLKNQNNIQVILPKGNPAAFQVHIFLSLKVIADTCSKTTVCTECKLPVFEQRTSIKNKAIFPNLHHNIKSYHYSKRKAMTRENQTPSPLNLAPK
jgi:hypothetical protein